MKISNIYNKIKSANIRLRVQLLIVLLTVILIPIIAISITTYITTIGKITELSLNNLKSDSYNTMKTIDVKINSLDSTIKGVSSQTNFLVGLEMANSTSGKMDTSIYSTIQLSMKNVVEGSDGLIETMYLCDKNGKVLVTGSKSFKTADINNFYDIGQFEKIKASVKNDVVVGTPFVSQELKKKVIPVTRKVNSLAGFSGTITALVNFDNFFKLDRDKLKSEIIVSDGDLNIISNQNDNGKDNKIAIGQYTNKEEVTYMDSGVKKIAHLEKSSITGWVICAQMNYSKVMSPVRQYTLILLIVAACSLLLAVFISVGYSKYISMPVVELTQQIKKIEEGYLEVNFKKESNISEINSLRRAFDKMVSYLNTLISDISTASKEIDKMSAVMYQETSNSFEKSEYTQNSIMNINTNIKNQADNTNYAAEGIQNLAKEIATTRELSKKVYSFLANLNTSAEGGKTQMDKLETNSNLNLHNISVMNEMITELQTEMKQINNITAAIQNIAKQTQLLSLNARIEASRAGEAGKGFAVVADEIKDLSNQTNSQAAIVRRLIESIVINSNNLCECFSEVRKGTELQNDCVNETEECFMKIQHNIDNINTQLHNITDYLLEMDNQKDNLVMLVKQINIEALEIANNSDHVQQYTRDHMTSIKKVHEKSNVFKNLSQSLNTSVSIFKV
jgi:methyl-accepting chemotaxis protein